MPADRVLARRIAIDPDPLEPSRIAAGYTVGDLICLSGQGAIDERGQLVGIGDFEAQAAGTLDNIENVLRAAGSGLDRVVKVTIYLTDMAANFGKVVQLRERWGRPYPADTIVEVSALAIPELLLEIDVIAVAGSVTKVG
ncbi:RidA family protein [Pseudonocardia hispaniensis]|uniref:RidA family protein n=1 Tax=Pseudonocardia hispaniensis TaxID=904933 RepID=A0ABW1J5S6_9PSEU